MNPLPVFALLFVILANSVSAKDSSSSSCSLALAFGLDISVSVDEAEYEMQRLGLATALNDPDVRSAILSRSDPVSLTAFEWSGKHQQSVIVPWSYINDESDMARFTDALLSHPRVDNEYPTAIGQALAFGVSLLNNVPKCARLVLDISGDGTNNDGFLPSTTYKHFPVAGITVNGLVIEGAEPGVVAYYLSNVIRGSGAFVEIADGFEDYSRAMKRKLLREIQQQQQLVLR